MIVLTGRAVINKKYCAEDCSKIDLKDLKPYMKKIVEQQEATVYDRYGNESKYIIENPDRVDIDRGGIRIILKYSITIISTEKVEEISYYVRLVKTSCNYGGYRWWFICPNHLCQKRVRVLYRSPASKYYACRHCHNLTYRSRQDHRSLYEMLFKRALWV